jgi:hypothetical protein
LIRGFSGGLGLAPAAIFSVGRRQRDHDRSVTAGIRDPHLGNFTQIPIPAAILAIAAAIPPLPVF